MDNQTIKVIQKIIEDKQRTDLDRDILETWQKLNMYPFDMNEGMKRVYDNNLHHPEIYAILRARPQTVIKPYAEITEMDVKTSLSNQLFLMASKKIKNDLDKKPY